MCRIGVLAIGPTSVAIAVKSIAMARHYLLHDRCIINSTCVHFMLQALLFTVLNHSLEIFCKPEFNVIEMENGEQRSGMYLCLLVVQT